MNYPRLLSKPINILTATFLTALLSACGGGSGGGSSTQPPPPPPVPMAQIAIVHAVSDAPDVNVRINGQTNLSAVEFATGSALQNRTAENISITLDTVLDTGIAIQDNVFSATGLNFDTAQDHYVVAVGKLEDQIDGGNTPIQASVISTSPTPGNGNIQLSVIHAAANAATTAVDIYVTPPNDPLSNNTAVGENLVLGQSASTTSFSAGTYQVRITEAGNEQNILLDTNIDAFASGQKVLLLALDHFGSGDSPLQLMVLDGSTGEESFFFDSNAGAELRFVNTLGNVGSDVTSTLNVAIDDTPLADLDRPFIPFFNANSLNFDNKSEYISLSAEPHSISVSGAQVIDAQSFDFELGQLYTAYAIGRAGTVLDPNDPTSFGPNIRLLQDDLRPIFGIAKARALVGYSELERIIGIFEELSVVLELDQIIPGGIRSFSNVDFGALIPAEGYLTLPSGSYTLSLDAPPNLNNTAQIIFNALTSAGLTTFGPITISDGTTSTIAIADDPNPFGIPPLISLTVPRIALVLDQPE